MPALMECVSGKRCSGSITLAGKGLLDTESSISSLLAPSMIFDSASLVGDTGQRRARSIV